MPTFTWQPAPGATQNKAPRVRSAQFGDGYQQRVADGINTTPRAWSVRFSRITTDIDAIDTFLAARAGTESFDWLPPAGTTGKWVCADWARSAAYGVQEISATFQEVHGD